MTITDRLSDLTILRDLALALLALARQRITRWLPA
jgi:hypothetical protein